MLPARLLAKAHDELGNDEASAPYHQAAYDISQRIRRLMWNEQAGFFYDLDRDGQQIPIKSALCFNPMLTDAVGPVELGRLVTHLNNPNSFNRPVRVPSLAADEKGYCPVGGYLLGGVWPFINAMILLGLERHGHLALATEIALNYWRAHVNVFRETGTVWEFLAPEKAAPGDTYDPRNTGCAARKDFAGWGAYSPISHLLEYAIGSARPRPQQHPHLEPARDRACGCRRYAFGEVIADVLCDARASANDRPVLHLTTNKPFTLKLNYGEGKSETIQVE